MNRMTCRTGAVGLVMCELCLIGGAGLPANAEARSTTEAGKTSQAAEAKMQGFYCNLKALSPAERARHKELTDKLLAARTKTVETEKGYELQYRGGRVTVGELADWTVAESKCCPFLDFHIDLEEEGRLVCLRLTGPQGVKPFIRLEFGI
jgi:hypothetical protein